MFYMFVFLITLKCGWREMFANKSISVITRPLSPRHPPSPPPPHAHEQQLIQTNKYLTTTNETKQQQKRGEKKENKWKCHSSLQSIK